MQDLPGMTLEDITQRWPATAAILEAHGLDLCCGGSRTLAEAAKEHGLPVDALVERLREAGAGGGEERVLDVRAMPPVQRHPTIFATFEALAPGEAFLLVNDHDPKPLFYQFQAERPGEFTWTPLETGPERWVIRIGKRGNA